MDCKYASPKNGVPIMNTTKRKWSALIINSTGVIPSTSREENRVLCESQGLDASLSSPKYDSMYKRPNPRPHTRRGACGPPKRIPTGTPGVLGDIATKMHRGTDHLQPKPTVWRPSYDYEFVALHEADPEAYLARVAAFFEQYPRPDPRSRASGPPLDLEPIVKLFELHGNHRPPINEHVTALRKAGYTEAVIDKVIARDALMAATVDARQEALDAIFARWPSINKPTPKPRASKPIKAVKKKMT